jgi:hypothetical protein
MLNYHVARRLISALCPFSNKEVDFEYSKSWGSGGEKCERVCFRRSLDQLEFIKPLNLAIVGSRHLHASSTTVESNRSRVSSTFQQLDNF